MKTTDKRYTFPLSDAQRQALEKLFEKSKLGNGATVREALRVECEKHGIKWPEDET